MAEKIKPPEMMSDHELQKVLHQLPHNLSVICEWAFNHKAEELTRNFGNSLTTDLSPLQKHLGNDAVEYLKAKEARMAVIGRRVHLFFPDAYDRAGHKIISSPDHQPDHFWAEFVFTLDDTLQKKQTSGHITKDPFVEAYLSQQQKAIGSLLNFAGQKTLN